MKIEARDHLDFLRQNIGHLASSIQPLWHPLGFASCVIREIKGDHTLRVHFWPSKERRTKNPDWPIHTHSYALSSLILQGRIEDIQYKTSEGNEYIVYQVAYSKLNSEIIKTQECVEIFETTTLIRSAGEQYSVERGVFHQSKVDFNSSAVTLVAISDFSNEPPLVLGRPGEIRYPYDRTPFDRDLFWSNVRDSIENRKQ